MQFPCFSAEVGLLNHAVLLFGQEQSRVKVRVWLCRVQTVPTMLVTFNAISIAGLSDAKKFWLRLRDGGALFMTHMHEKSIYALKISYFAIYILLLYRRY